MNDQQNEPAAWQKQVRHKESGQLSWVDVEEYVSGWSYEETGETRALYAEPLRATSDGAGMKIPRIMTYQVAGGWAVSEYQTGVDGVYETQAAAIMAVDADPAAIAELAARHRIITEAEVIALRLAEEVDEDDE